MSIPQAETIARCPFCSNDEIMVVLYESDSIRVFPDVRPVVPGHFLIATSTHYQSMEDQPPVHYQRVRVAQQEIARRVRAGWGPVASAYEHGRSAICRFHASDRGDTHAHVHVLPTDLDVLVRSQTMEHSQRRPATSELQGADRYIYQSLDGRDESWGWRPKSVPRHFLRVALQAGLEDQGRAYICLDAPQTEHIATIQESAAVFREHRDPALHRVTVDGWDPTPRRGCAAALARAWNATPVDTATLLDAVLADHELTDQAALADHAQALHQQLLAGQLAWTTRDDHIVLACDGSPLPSSASPQADARRRGAMELPWLMATVERLLDGLAQRGRVVVAGMTAASDAITLRFGSDPDPSAACRFSTQDLDPHAAALVAIEAVRFRMT
ncbi:MAG: HIT domain-containing protein [Deltaproteobacteria bacterium]|nr:HIT domain-containing protein [Deltaproteobacteria bacterium]